MDFLLHHHDLKIDQGDIALCPDDNSCLSQTISIKLKTIYGEWFLDTTQGIPYFTHIFGQHRSPSYIRELIVPKILSINGIKKVNNFSVSMESNRKLLISFDVVFSNGQSLYFTEILGV